MYHSYMLYFNFIYMAPNYNKCDLKATFHVGDLGPDPLHERCYLQEGSLGPPG